MSETPLLRNDWYEEFIAQTAESFGEDTSDDAKAVAQGIMVAGALIAEAIDLSLGRYDDNMENAVSQLLSIREALSEITT